MAYASVAADLSSCCKLAGAKAYALGNLSMNVTRLEVSEPSPRIGWSCSGTYRFHSKSKDCCPMNESSRWPIVAERRSPAVPYRVPRTRRKRKTGGAALELTSRIGLIFGLFVHSKLLCLSPRGQGIQERAARESRMKRAQRWTTRWTGPDSRRV